MSSAQSLSVLVASAVELQAPWITDDPRKDAAGFYRELTASFRFEQEQPTHRYFAGDAMILDEMMIGIARGTFFGLPGNNGRITISAVEDRDTCDWAPNAPSGPGEDR